MSFANYLNRATNIPTLEQLELGEEPNELTDSSRVGDAITYTSSATYPLSPATTSTLTPLETSFVPLFQVGLSAEDYLNVALPFNPATLPAGASELANIDYFMYVLGNSVPRFNLRYAVYDASLNRVQAYQTLNYDPSANPYQSPLISSLEVKGFSIEYPPTARYGFIEAQNIDGSGSLAVQFAYATNTTQLSFDSQTAGGSRSSKNQFVLDFGDYNADASGLEPQIQANTANIVVLQSDVSVLDASVNALESSVAGLPPTIASKLPLAGGTMTGAINMGTFGITNVASPSASTDVATKAYVDAQTGGGSGGALPLAGGTMAGNISMAGFDVSGLPNVPPTSSSASSKAYVDTKVDDYLPLAGGTMTGSLLMGGSRIQGVATPLLGTDATTKSYVDSQDALRLPLTGGALTGNLSTTGDITCATLNYTTLNPPVAGSSQNLSQVLTTGNSAGGQSITNVNGITATTLTTTRIINNSGTTIFTTSGAGGTQTFSPAIPGGLNTCYFIDRRPNNIGIGGLDIILPGVNTAPPYTFLGTTATFVISGSGNANFTIRFVPQNTSNHIVALLPYSNDSGNLNWEGAGNLIYTRLNGASIPATLLATTNDAPPTGLFRGTWGNQNYQGLFGQYNAIVVSPTIIKAECILYPVSSIEPPVPVWLLTPVGQTSAPFGTFLTPL